MILFMAVTTACGMLVGVILGWLVTIRTRRRLKHRVKFLHTLIQQIPAGLFYQDLSNPQKTFASQSICDFFCVKPDVKWPQILATFEDPSKTTLDNAYKNLQKNGQAFTLFLPNQSSAFHFVITGHLIHSPEAHASVIQFFDVSDTAHKLQLTNLMEHHKNILATAMESLPFPLFIRDAKGLGFFANKAVNKENTSTLNELSWLSIPFQVDNTFYTLTYGKETKTEEELNIILDHMVMAQRRLCTELPCAVCLFNAAGQMLACSPAFTKLWHLNKNWIDSEPSYEEYWDAIQDNGLLSRVADFADYKKQQRENFARLSSVNQLFLYLPDGRIIQRTMIPYVQGSVILLDEEQTNTKK